MKYKGRMIRHGTLGKAPSRKGQKEKEPSEKQEDNQGKWVSQGLREVRTPGRRWSHEGQWTGQIRKNWKLSTRVNRKEEIFNLVIEITVG